MASESPKDVSRVVIFANLGQPPFDNNLLPAVRAFERLADVRVVAPHRHAGFVGTGGAEPAEIPGSAVDEALEEGMPDLAICLGGGLVVGDRSRFAASTRWVGVALSDPLGLAASFEIAPRFDLFYTQDPQCLPAYGERGLDARRLDIAVDPDLLEPAAEEAGPPRRDVIFYGKHTPYRDEILGRLAAELDVALFGHAWDERWSLEPLPALVDSAGLAREIARSRLALELAVLDDAPEPWKDTWRITYRPFFAAACGVPTLVESSPRLGEYFRPGEEIATFESPDDVVSSARRLLADDEGRREMGRAARRRLRAEHTWRHRARQILRDLQELGTLAALILVVILAACGPAPSPVAENDAGRPPHVILVTVDTLRADRLGVYGHVRDTSPRIDRWAAGGVVFERAYAPSAVTCPTHASLFTSRLPPSTGVLSNRQRFPGHLPTLMDVLGDAGYFTVGAVSSVALARQFGLQNELHRFDDDLTSHELNRPGIGERPAEETLAAARRLVAERPADRPLFLWVHLIDPHGPYVPPREADRFVSDAHYDEQSRGLPLGDGPFPGRAIPGYQRLGEHREVAFYEARYDAEIRYVDAELGAFFDHLEAEGILGDALVILTSDHGETLAETNRPQVFSHGVLAHEEVVRVPLIVRPPPTAPGASEIDWSDLVASRPVALVDLAPSVLEWLGLEAPESFLGRSWWRPEEGDEIIVSFGAHGSARLEEEIGSQHSVLRGPWRFVRSTGDGSVALYDHRDDPLEQADVAAEHPGVATELEAELDRLFRELPRVRSRAIEEDEELREQLRALGYAE